MIRRSILCVCLGSALAACGSDSAGGQDGDDVVADAGNGVPRTGQDARPPSTDTKAVETDTNRGKVDSSSTDAVTARDAQTPTRDSQTPPPARDSGQVETTSDAPTSSSDVAPDAVRPSDASERPDASGCVIPKPGDKPVGYGAAATGGGSATPINVSSMADIVAELAKYKKGTSGLVLRYTGTFDFASIKNPCDQFRKAAQTIDIKEVSNVTILGAPGSAANFGLHISRASNIVIRNMTFGLLPGGGSSDAISIEGASSNIWIDHNELFSSLVECEGAGDTEFDGLLDTKAGSHHITISYNYFHDHHKVGLNGSGDSDEGERFITFHHNRYENVGSRVPMQRFGTTHIYNNYYNKVLTSGINVRMGGISLIESNYFEHVRNPVTSRDSDQLGFWDLRDNFVGDGITWSPGEGTFANATEWKTTKAFTGTLGYDYRADSAACVKAIVQATAGAKL